MNATRIRKEARAMLLPWCGVMVSTLVFLAFFRDGLFGDDAISALHSMTFWLGVPLLASLSIGHEFQHNTMAILFSQPVNRITIWLEKWIVLIPAVVTATWAYVIVDSVISQSSSRNTVDIVLAALIATCSATFLTFIARSSTNSLMLNVVILGGLMIAEDVTRNFLPYHEIVGIAFAGVMLWLSYRVLVTAEVSGAQARKELAVLEETYEQSPSLIRCRPGQPWRNLLRKEVRLLWPFWLVLAIILAGGVFLAMLQFTPFVDRDIPALIAFTGINYLSPLLAIFSGCLLVGEERVSGTFLTQETLPISKARLWAVKVVVALVAAELGMFLPFAVSLPLFGRYSFGTPLVVPTAPMMLVLIGFCCALVVKGTLRAALLVLPVAAGAFLIEGIGRGYAFALGQSHSLDALLLKLHPYPFITNESRPISMFGLSPQVLLMFGLTVTALAISYPLFRRGGRDLRFGIVVLLFLVLMAVPIGFVGSLPKAMVWRSNELWNRALMEGLKASAHLKVQEASVQVSVDELAKVGGISEASRAALRLTEITATPESFKIRFKNGSVCKKKVSFFKEAFFSCDFGTWF
jgi:ABC-type transport system involved in multi-copper enzyme maturation permease subunit